MTRDYFDEYVNDYGDLLDFCDEVGCEYLSDVIREEDLDSHVCDDIRNAMRFDTWDTIRDELCNIQEGYDYYRRNGSFNYDSLSEYDFEDDKNAVLEWAEENGVFDDEDEEDAREESEEVKVNEVIEEEESEDENWDQTISELLFSA